MTVQVFLQKRAGLLMLSLAQQLFGAFEKLFVRLLCHTMLQIHKERSSPDLLP
ncbi:MAG: hypothetical protein IPG44_17885 [Anaerolineales bacterium]|nr:hypothetical protein [Anaerolineales bacterium]